MEFITEHGWNVVPADKVYRTRPDVSLSSTDPKISPSAENQEVTSLAASTAIGSADVTASGLRAGGLRSSTTSNTLCMNFLVGILKLINARRFLFNVNCSF